MTLDLKEIRELAKRFSPEQIECCIEQQLETGSNVCIRNESEEKMINELAKAQFIRERIEEGLSLADALRDLARRMRLIHERMK
jgi:hypothetical protein